MSINAPSSEGLISVVRSSLNHTSLWPFGITQPFTFIIMKTFQITLTCLILTVAVSNGMRRFGVKNKSYGDNPSPFVLLYEHESFRGKEWVQSVGKQCLALPKEVAGAASSVDSHRSCVSVCQDTNCQGPCHKVFSNQGISKLRLIGFNDNIRSLRSCY